MTKSYHLDPARRAPLDYCVRISRRARYLQLRVNGSGGIEVVVPQGCDTRTVPLFVAQHRDWLERTVARLQAGRLEDPTLGAALPDRIRLHALDEDWRVVLDPALGPRVLGAPAGGGPLRVGGAQPAQRRGLLQGWLSLRARRALDPWLRAVSEEIGLAYARCSVRAQKTRWGSCSPRNTISLNRGLLFLPPGLVRYLFVHELCHTVHRNHSRRFWALVARHEPDYRRLDAELREAARYVPLWACRD